MVIKKGCCLCGHGALRKKALPDECRGSRHRPPCGRPWGTEEDRCNRAKRRLRARKNEGRSSDEAQIAGPLPAGSTLVYCRSASGGKNHGISGRPRAGGGLERGAALTGAARQRAPRRAAERRAGKTMPGTVGRGLWAAPGGVFKGERGDCPPIFLLSRRRSISPSDDAFAARWANHRHSVPGNAPCCSHICGRPCIAPGASGSVVARR